MLQGPPGTDIVEVGEPQPLTDTTLSTTEITPRAPRSTNEPLPKKKKFTRRPAAPPLTFTAEMVGSAREERELLKEVSTYYSISF